MERVPRDDPFFQMFAMLPTHSPFLEELVLGSSLTLRGIECVMCTVWAEVKIITTSSITAAVLQESATIESGLELTILAKNGHSRIEEF